MARLQDLRMRGGRGGAPKWGRGGGAVVLQRGPAIAPHPAFILLVPLPYPLFRQATL
jgi:hypothetical protein